MEPKRMSKALVFLIERRYELSFTALLLLAYTYLAITHPNAPISSLNITSSWFGWWDQSKYYESAAAFARLDLSQENHWYPAGYPMLGSIFYHLMPFEPFFAINLILFGIYTYYLIKFLLRFIAPGFCVLSIVLALFATNFLLRTQAIPSIIEQFIIPWNTTPVAACYMILLYLLSDRSTRPHHAALGIIVGLVFWFRPIDALPAILVVGVMATSYLRNRNYSIFLKSALRFLIGILTAIAPLTLLNLAIYGSSILGAYGSTSTSIGLSFYNIPERFFWIFADPSSVWNEGSGILDAYPWLYILLPFFLFAFLHQIKNIWPAFLLCISSLIIYLSYNDFSPHNVFRFHLIHYIAWMFPLFCGLGLYGIIQFVKTPEKYFIVVLAVWVGWVSGTQAVIPIQVSNLAIKEGYFSITLPSNSNVSGVDVFGVISDDWMRTSTSDLRLEIDGRKLTPFNGYKVTPIKSGIRVIFNQKVYGQLINFQIPLQTFSIDYESASASPVYFLFSPY